MHYGELNPAVRRIISLIEIFATAIRTAREFRSKGTVFDVRWIPPSSFLVAREKQLDVLTYKLSSIVKKQLPNSITVCGRPTVFFVWNSSGM